MKTVHPYLNFDGNTEEAFNFYRSVFGGDFVGGISRFRDFGDGMGVGEHELDLIAHIALPLGPHSLLMGTDAVASMGMPLHAGNNSYIMLDCESAAEAADLFGKLSEGGTVQMELQRTEWAERYASFTDRFGTAWMIYFEGDTAPAGSGTEA